MSATICIIGYSDMKNKLLTLALFSMAVMTTACSNSSIEEPKHITVEAETPEEPAYDVTKLRDNILDIQGTTIITTDYSIELDFKKEETIKCSEPVSFYRTSNGYPLYKQEDGIYRIDDNAKGLIKAEDVNIGNTNRYFLEDGELYSLNELGDRNKIARGVTKAYSEFTYGDGSLGVTSHDNLLYSINSNRYGLYGVHNEKRIDLREYGIYVDDVLNVYFAPHAYTLIIKDAVLCIEFDKLNEEKSKVLTELHNTSPIKTISGEYVLFENHELYEVSRKDKIKQLY